jgi:hypothetical protein
MASEAQHRAMTPREIETLASDAAAFDAVVILWRTGSGTQPVLLPRSLGQPTQDARVGPATRITAAARRPLRVIAGRPGTSASRRAPRRS